MLSTLSCYCELTPWVQLALMDGRRLLRMAEGAALDDRNVIPIHADFRLIVLANRPGFPFMGNDFFRECGDVFAAHAIDALDLKSELALLNAYAPTVPQKTLADLAILFSDLRVLSDSGSLAYPYSTRELVKLCQHLEKFPTESISAACSSVFSFDVYDNREQLTPILQRHGLDSEVAFAQVPLAGANTFSIDDHLLYGSAAEGCVHPIMPVRQSHSLLQVSMKTAKVCQKISSLLDISTPGRLQSRDHPWAT